MFLLFFLLWIIFNGRITVEVCILGLFISLAVFLFVCKFLGHSIKAELSIYSHFPRIIQFIGVLVFDVVKANVAVIRLILTSKEEIEPRLVEFSHELNKAELSAFLSNSITITPGTITVANEEGKLLVHCLDESMSGDFKDAKTYKILKDYFDEED